MSVQPKDKHVGFIFRLRLFSSLCLCIMCVWLFFPLSVCVLCVFGYKNGRNPRQIWTKRD